MIPVGQSSVIGKRLMNLFVAESEFALPLWQLLTLATVSWSPPNNTWWNLSLQIVPSWVEVMWYCVSCLTVTAYFWRCSEMHTMSSSLVSFLGNSPKGIYSHWWGGACVVIIIIVVCWLLAYHNRSFCHFLCKLMSSVPVDNISKCQFEE